MFCNGCTTEQQTPAPPGESSKQTSLQQTPDQNTQGSSANAVPQVPAANELTEGADNVKAQLEELGARIDVNEQGEIVDVDINRYLYNTQITDEGLVHLSGLTSLAALDLDETQINSVSL